jgi:hypothetical protein
MTLDPHEDGAMDQDPPEGAGAGQPLVLAPAAPEAAHHSIGPLQFFYNENVTDILAAAFPVSRHVKASQPSNYAGHGDVQTYLSQLPNGDSVFSTALLGGQFPFALFTAK